MSGFFEDEDDEKESELKRIAESGLGQGLTGTAIGGLGGVLGGLREGSLKKYMALNGLMAGAGGAIGQGLGDATGNDTAGDVGGILGGLGGSLAAQHPKVSGPGMEAMGNVASKGEALAKYLSKFFSKKPHLKLV